MLNRPSTVQAPSVCRGNPLLSSTEKPFQDNASDSSLLYVEAKHQRDDTKYLRGEGVIAVTAPMLGVPIGHALEQQRKEETDYQFQTPALKRQSVVASKIISGKDLYESSGFIFGTGFTAPVSHADQSQALKSRPLPAIPTQAAPEGTTETPTAALIPKVSSVADPTSFDDDDYEDIESGEEGSVIHTPVDQDAASQVTESVNGAEGKRPKHKIHYGRRIAQKFKAAANTPSTAVESSTENAPSE